MTLTMVVIGVLVAAGIVYLGLLPILSERQQSRQVQQRYDTQYTLQDIQARYELLLNSILDLDTDYDMGKINQTVYQEQRKMLIGRSVYVRKQLDALEAEALMIDDAELEALIAARRQQRSRNRDAELEAQIAAFREKTSS